MKKRLFSLFMVFTLCFVSVDQAYADAGSLIIAGGSVAGVAAGAIAGPAVVAVFCAMMAFGMNVELTQASQEAGMTKTEFLKTKLEQYCTEARISYDTFNQYVLGQTDILRDGAIALGNNASSLVKRFCNWLFETDSVISDSGDSYIVGGNAYKILQPGENGVICTFSFNGYPFNALYAYNDGNYPIAITLLSNGNYYQAFMFSLEPYSDVNVKYQQYINGSLNYEVTKTTYQNSINNVYYNEFNSYEKSTVSNLSTTIPIFNGSIREFCNSIETTVNDADTITGNENTYENIKSVLDTDTGQTVVVNPNITIPIPVDKDVTIDVNEYLEEIQELIDGVADDIITAIDDATGIPIEIEFDPTQDWDPTIEKENDTDLPPDDDKTPIVPDELIPVDYDIDPLTFDLKGLFPFCIPWDIRDMLLKLNASPVAPSYTVNWDIPIVNETLTFTIDLSPYNDVADTLRKMEVLAFCIGLALITRQMILRG